MAANDAVKSVVCEATLSQIVIEFAPLNRATIF